MKRLLSVTLVSLAALAAYAQTTEAPKGPVQPSWDIQQAARAGDAAAQFTLGYDYMNGLGVPQDGVLAVSWFLKSAAQGYPNAERDLGVIYDQGLCRQEKNPGLALRYFTQAASHGDSMAQYALGQYYGMGVNTLGEHVAAVSLNPKESVKWLQMSANQGNPAAWAMLGIHYEAGNGVPKDLVEACKWLSLSYDYPGQLLPSEFVQKAKEQLEGILTPAQKQEAKKRELKWVEEFRKKRAVSPAPESLSR